MVRISPRLSRPNHSYLGTFVRASRREQNPQPLRISELRRFAQGLTFARAQRPNAVP